MPLSLNTLTQNDVRDFLESIATEISVCAIDNLRDVTDQQEALFESRKMFSIPEFKKRTDQLLEEKKKWYKVECIFDNPNNQNFCFMDNQGNTYRLNYADYFIKIDNTTYSNQDYPIYMICDQIKKVLLSPLEQPNSAIRYVNLNAVKVLRKENPNKFLIQTLIVFRITK
jgi:hypothetical protein